MSKNKGYWEARHEQWIKNQDRDDAAVAGKLQTEYKRTARELEKDIARFFQQYGQDNVIEFRAMMLDLSQADKDLLFQDMEAFANRYPEYADLIPVRESIYRLNRLQGLHYSTQMKLLELGAIEQKELEKHLEKTYGKHYKNMLQELGIGNQFLSISDELMKDTIFAKWVNGENFSDRIWKNKEGLLNHLQTIYRDGLARGDNYAKLSKAIMERFDVGANDARRLVWTEASFVMNQSHTHAYINADVEEYEISAIMDNKTSPICREMDGKVFRFDEMEVGLNFPPFHPYCRTTFIGFMGQTNRGQFSSTKEAYKSVRYSGIDRDFAKQIDERYLDLANTYPIGTENMTLRSLQKPRVFGLYQNQIINDRNGILEFRNEIVLSNAHMKSYDMSKNKHTNDARIRGSKNTSALSTVDHEYAHAIDNAYALKRDPQLEEDLKSWVGIRLTSSQQVREINRLNNELSTSSRNLSNDLKAKLKNEYGLNEREFFEKVNTELGTYAASSTKEFLAEGFSAYRHIPTSEQSEFVKRFGELFESLFWEVF